MGDNFGEKRYLLNKGISYRKILDDYIVVNARGSEVLTLNETGGRILELIDEGLTVNEIKNKFVEEFDTTGANFEEDLAQYIDSLLNEHIITEND